MRRVVESRLVSRRRHANVANRMALRLRHTVQQGA
jgi:hypothetical protein